MPDCRRDIFSRGVHEISLHNLVLHKIFQGSQRCMRNSISIQHTCCLAPASQRVSLKTIQTAVYMYVVHVCMGAHTMDGKSGNMGIPRHSLTKPY